MLFKPFFSGWVLTSLPERSGIKINLSREIKGKILYLHISKTTTDNYYVSFTCEVPKDSFPMTGKMTGIDVGIKHAAILSDGTKYENIKALKKLQKKLQYEQRQLSKKQKGSNSRRKQRQKVARLHERIKNLRETHLHKISTDTIKRHDIVITENLAVENLIKNHCIAKALSDVALGKLITQLKYKSDLHDRTYAQVDRFFPSSKTCFVCGEKNENLKLSDRTWICNCCHTEHDRDINAAKNILKEGLRILSDCGTQPDTKQKRAKASPLGRVHETRSDGNT